VSNEREYLYEQANKAYELLDETEVRKLAIVIQNINDWERNAEEAKEKLAMYLDEKLDIDELYDSTGHSTFTITGGQYGNESNNET